MACTTCTSAAPSDRAGVPLHFVTVNETVIAADEISREMSNHPAETPAASWHNAAQALVLKALLVERAKALQLSPHPQTDSAGRVETAEEAVIRAVIEADVQVPDADRDACRRYYANNTLAFTSPTLFEASHIFMARKGGPATIDTLQATALAVLTDVITRPERFADLAREHSDCPSRMTGGSLGQLSGGDTVAEFEAALPTMKVGVIYEALIETRFGFHIVRLDRRIEAQVLPFDAVAASIAQFLNGRVQRVAMRQYAQRLLSAARISGLALPKGTGPLLQ